MLTIKYQTAFKKDYKRIIRRGYDMRLLEEAQSAANDLLDGDPSLSGPAHALLRRRIDRLFAVNEGGLN